MRVAYIVAAALAALMLSESARIKVVRNPRAVQIIGETVGVPLRYFNLLAFFEVAGGVGLLLGIAVRPLGVAAAIGLTSYFVGATLSHVRVRDWAFDHWAPAAWMLIVSVATLVLRLAA